MESILKTYISPAEMPPQDQSFKNDHKQNSLAIKENPILDVDATIKILGNMEFIQDVFDLLRKDLINDVKEIKTAQKSNDVQTLRNLFHKIRGGLCYFKAPQLEAAIVELHDSLKTKSLSDCLILFDKFYEAVEALLAVHL